MSSACMSIIKVGPPIYICSSIYSTWSKDADHVMIQLVLFTQWMVGVGYNDCLQNCIIHVMGGKFVQGGHK